MRMTNLCKLAKMDLLINYVHAFQDFMHYDVQRNKNLWGTNLCDRCLTYVFCININLMHKLLAVQ